MDDGLILGPVVRGEEERDGVDALELHETQWEHLCKVVVATFSRKVIAATLRLNEYGNPGPCLRMAWADTDNPVY